MKATLLAKSSSGESYKVEFSAENSDVRIFCHCQAGVLHRMCKHKQALIDGNVEMLFDPNQTELLSEIRAWPQFKNLQKHFETFSKQLAEIEKARRELDKKENKSKQNLAKD
jgi:hypothetical protein